MTIIHLKHNKIDKTLWDEKITSAKNGVVYAMSWYLDLVSPGWEALVAEDYDYIMPLPVKSKHGLRYLTQPYFSQQLGVFSSNMIQRQNLQEFIKSIPYKLYRLQLNAGNNFNDEASDLRPNFILELNRNYDLIAANYSKNARRNLKKAESTSQIISLDQNTKEFWSFVSTNLNFEPPVGLMPVLKKLLLEVISNGKGKIVSAIDKETSKVLAAVLFVNWKNRIYYLMPSSSADGKENQSMSLLLDRFIKENSERDIIIDFEGSSIEGVARFYKGFGATPEYYPLLNYNGLIFPFNKINK